MDFGRIANPQAVNYELPADHKTVVHVLGGTRPVKPRVYVGGVLWAEPGFVGTLYPPKTEAKDYVKCYTRQFNTIELNATHYNIPESATLNYWRNSAPAGFKFCPKVHRDISHADNLITMIGLHNDHAKRLQLLEDKLGTTFLQLPPNFTPRRMHELLDFIKQSQLKNMALELRHADWFKDETALNTLCNCLYKHKMPLVITDTPGRRDVLHMRFTAKTLFVRFNANNIESDKTRIQDWLRRINTWLELGLEDLYFFVHCPRQLTMPVLVDYFIAELYKTCRIKLAAPLLNEWASGV